MSTDGDLGRIVQALSAKRLQPYRRACGDDLPAAVRPYEWNVTASGAFYEALSIAEVVLRNALHAQLTAFHATLAGHWYDDPMGVLSEAARDDITTARARVQRLGRSETPGRILAELNLSFWKFLLAKRYETSLWKPSAPRLSPPTPATAGKGLRCARRAPNLA